MNCDESRDAMIGILYGEEPSSRVCFDFFKHLDACPDCSAEYGELLGTREMLQGWEVEEADEPLRRVTKSEGAARTAKRWVNAGWWPVLQKLAAGFLILMGGSSIFQHYGYLGGPKVLVSEQQLTEMVQDLVVANQAEERQVVRQAMVKMKDDLDLERRQDMREVYNYLVSLEQRYANNLEENNRYLKTLASR